MSKIILQCAISKDGFIARKDGTFDFLTMPTDKAFHEYFNQFLNQIDSIVMGYHTFDVIKQYGQLPFEHIEKRVFTRNHLNIEVEGVTFINQSIESFVKTNHQTVWLFGGADLFTQFLEIDAIDEIHVYQELISIGEGIPLFHRKDWEKHYEKPELTSYQQGRLLKYKKRNTLISDKI